MSHDNTNSGMLARNDRKERDNQPDFTGVINVDGVDYWLSAWTKVGGEGSKMAGRKYFSLAVTRKDGQAAAKHSGKQRAEDNISDDEVPF